MNDITAAERMILGTIIENITDVPLPLPFIKLLDAAPDSFGDPRHKQISSAIQSLQSSGKAIHISSIQERLDFEGSSVYLLQIASDALPLSVATIEADTVWQGFRERKTAAVFAEAFEQVTENPSLTKAITSGVKKTLQSLDDENYQDGLPDIIDAADMVATSPILPDELIKGMLHYGSKLSLGGSAKAGKSWTFLDIAISLASGSDWLGLETKQTRVLYINMEIQKEFFHKRVETLCLARLIFPDPGWLDIWNLRGFSAPHHVLIPKVIKRAQDRGYGAIIFDPSYKLIPEDADENSASHIGALMRSFEEVTISTGTAVLFGAHFAKGNASQKDVIDRVSGSGVWARDPDCIMTLTKHEEDDCYSVEAALRNLPPLEPFVVRWVYPRFTRQEDLDPANLKQSKPGRKKKYTREMLLECLGTRSLIASEWKKDAFDRFGIPRTPFYDLLAEIREKNLAIESVVTKRWTAVSTITSGNP